MLAAFARVGVGIFQLRNPPALLQDAAGRFAIILCILCILILF